MPIIFRLKDTAIGRTVLIDRIVPKFLRRALFFIFILLAAAAFSLVLLGGVEVWKGVALILLSIVFILGFFELFFDHGLASPALEQKFVEAVALSRGQAVINIARYAVLPVAKAVFGAGSPPNIRRILLALIQLSRTDFIFSRLGINKKELVQALSPGAVLRSALAPGEVPGPAEDTFANAIEQAALHAYRARHERLEIGDMLYALADAEFAFRKFLFDRGIDQKDFDRVLHWEDRLWHQGEHQKKFWHRDNLLRLPGIAIDWAAAYTPTLDRYAKDLTSIIAEQGWEVRLIGRKGEIRAIERALAKTGENNALLVGEPGVGKETVIYGFAKRVLSGRSLPPLNRKRVVELDMQAVISGLKTAGEIEDRLRKILQETIRAGNIILVITDFQNFIHASTAVGMIDISAALVPFIRTSAVQLVATTTYQGLHENIEKNPEVLNQFEKIEIQPPDPDVVFAILVDLLPIFEYRHKVFFSFQALKQIIELSDRYVQDVPFPEKAIDLLGDTAIFVSNQKRPVVTAQDIATVLSERIQIPVGEVAGKEREKLLHLEKFIHERIVDQEEAVTVISEAMRRERAGVRGTIKRPIGTFLFLGPTGVGKTETAKALAEAYFGSDERMIRLDMSEYQKQDALDRLIGSPATGEEGRLSVSVREDPFSLLLLDEIEKTHPKILDLFLQIFDEGEATDGWGRKIVFSNTIIIATSNAGAEFIREQIQKGAEAQMLKHDLTEHILSQGIFRPEFVNRFDAVVLFRPLSVRDVTEIAQLKINKLARQLEREKGIYLRVPNETIAKLVALGFSQEFGARELNRVIQERIEGTLAKEILSGRLKRGDVFVVSL